jgi:uncharacterized protein YbcI
MDPASRIALETTQEHGDTLSAISDGLVEQRMEFQQIMRDRFEGVIEAAVGRKVIGFMSGNQQEPDMMCEVFVLAPSDLLSD